MNPFHHLGHGVPKEGASCPGGEKIIRRFISDEFDDRFCEGMQCGASGARVEGGLELSWVE